MTADRQTHSSCGATQVLVVDDDLRGLRLAENILSLMGLEVMLVVDGIECLAAFRARKFDLIFMDSLMPNLNGHQTTAKIRKLEAELGLARTPIVALTASAFPDEIRQFFCAGADDALVKPYRIEELAAKVAQWAFVSHTASKPWASTA